MSLAEDHRLLRDTGPLLSWFQPQTVQSSEALDITKHYSTVLVGACGMFQIPVSDIIGVHSSP